MLAKRATPYSANTRMMNVMGAMRTPTLLFAGMPVRNFAYHQNVIDHYENPRNVGSLDKKDSDVGTGLVGAPACGDVMKL